MNRFIHITIILLILYYIFLSVNPVDNTYTKEHVLNFINKKYTLSLNKIDSLKDIYKIKKYPIVLKPIICNGNGKGVIKINSKNDLIQHIKNNKNISYISQDLYMSKYEAGILYERYPLQKDGKIKSIVFKKILENKWKPLRCKNMLYKKGINCEIRDDIITRELTHVINRISKKIPNFYAGRYDIRFDNIDDLKKGKNFKILELNGSTGFDLKMSIFTNYNLLNYCKISIRWLIVRFIIGLQNILLFNNQNIFKSLSIFINSVNRAYKCNNLADIFIPSSF